jgi:hypothetical protein
VIMRGRAELSDNEAEIGIFQQRWVKESPHAVVSGFAK